MIHLYDEQWLVNRRRIGLSLASPGWLTLSGSRLRSHSTFSPKDERESFSSGPLGGWLTSLRPAWEVALLWLTGQISLPLSLPHGCSF